MSQRTLSVPANIPPPARQLANILQILFKIPKNQTFQLLEQGYVTLNGRVKRQSFHVVEVGDSITVDVVPQPISAPSISAKSKSSNRAIDFLFDDADIAIVNKPANLLTVPTKHREAHTLVSLVERHIAIVAGIPSPESRVLKNYLSTDADLNRYIVHSPDQGELAITHFETKQVWRDASMLEVKLETGRRNQIRIQLAEIGHPILGDPRYKPRQAEHWAWPHHRIALHAETLGFQHPRTKEAIQIETQWPQEFRDFMRHQRKNT